MKLIERLFNKRGEEANNAIERNKIELEKHKVNLDKTINLMEKHKTLLLNHKARVLVVMDYSVSMSNKYEETKCEKHDSEVQKILTKLFPISLKFDDDGELDVYLFQTRFIQMIPMTRNNFSTYVSSVIKESGYKMSGTKYSPVLRNIVNEYFTTNVNHKNLIDKDEYPVFVLFITDGDNSDKTEATELIREIAKLNIFIQFVGISNEKFNYLEELDNLEDRIYDNVGFEKFSSLAKEDDIKVYNKLLKQYIEWLKVRKIYLFGQIL